VKSIFTTKTSKTTSAAWSIFWKRIFCPFMKNCRAFCHGDYHPMNIIWSTDGIRCVIDWEFCGLKSELYDVANLIGCIGMENPRSLAGGLVGHFIDRMKRSGIMSQISWRYLTEFIIALRFAWLAEWLRRKDRNMIRLERDYMKLLMDNKTVLQKAWL